MSKGTKKVKLKRVGGGAAIHVWNIGLVETGQEVEVPKTVADSLLLLMGEFELAGTTKKEEK